MLDFFNVFIVSMVLFIVVFKISCVCNVPSFIRSNLLQEVVLTKKTCTTNIFGMCKCLCEDFQHFNVCACFVKGVFFWNFQLTRISPFMHNCCEKSFKKNMDMMHGKNINLNLMLVYFQQAMCSTHIYMYIYIYIYGSKSFAFVVGALLLLHLVLWFLNHVAI